MDQAQLSALRQAALGASSIQAPTSPLGSFPELAKLHQSAFQLPQSNAATKAIGYQTGVSEDNRKEALKKQAQDLEAQTNSRNYKKLRRADGGFDWIDPQGNKVDVNTVAQRTGESRASLLADSENADDLKYSRDYKYLNEYLGALMDQDEETLKAFQEKDPNLKYFKKPQELIDYFQNYYGSYYGRSTQTNQSGAIGNRADRSGVIFANPQVSQLVSAIGG